MDQIVDPFGDGCEAAADQPKVAVGGLRFQIMFGATGHWGSSWKNASKLKSHVSAHPLITNWFIADQKERKYSKSVEGFTEHRQKGHTYRSHPNYQSSGPWYDWVLVHFDDSNENTAEVRNGKQGGAKKQKISHLYPSTDVPSKILCFYTDPIEGDVRALVHSCEYSDHVDVIEV